MRTREAIDADIAAAQSELQNVHGSTTEVYARIVGYYRSVCNWNKGKREEFSERKMFEHENPKTPLYAGQSTVVDTGTTSIQYPAFFEVYTRKTCPNCPPVISVLISVISMPTPKKVLKQLQSTASDPVLPLSCIMNRKKNFPVHIRLPILKLIA